MLVNLWTVSTNVSALLELLKYLRFSNRQVQFQRVRRRSSIFAAKVLDDVINIAPDLRVEAGGGLIEEKLNVLCETPTHCLRRYVNPRRYLSSRCRLLI